MTMITQPNTQPAKKFFQTAAFGVPEYEMKREGTYKPRIAPNHLFKLWLLKQRTKKPITKLIADALDMYLSNEKI